ncbi:hypothetical protein A8C75_06760 [Marinobacterium aestuarii]|uniref:CRISPR type III-associated protein domain-containing protein n=2 Tax=Marinobacterium aestuarii TaxID=1821621 RepID=A0A1A9EX52_9GAMM|nr:RAMP superfamily CRISPR-associated protein [Marinobacterium aestuarii]ANG62221.1 hypothetical protein A8C75_06760 [Marinobacterium aestuarii]
MFLGEANQACAQQIRPPAIKGALRFWWRALNWARLRQQAPSDQVALQQLHHEESALFGQATRDESRGPSGQAGFLLRVSQQHVHVSDQDFANTPELQYLLGQGLYSKGLKRSYLQSGGHFTLQLALKRGLTDGQKQQLIEALLCFGLLGNLGSRARKGFGSITINRLEVSGQPQPLPTNQTEYKHAIAELLGPTAKADEPPFSAFSRLSQLQVGASGNDAIALLRQHGFEMGMYRGYGRNKLTFGREAEQKFKPDHDWAYEVSEGKRQGRLPSRAVFGLPHPYFLSSTGKNVSIDVDVDGVSGGRRASPLFAHLHRLPDGQFLLIHLLLRSLFLPDSASVKVKGKGAAHFELSGNHVNQQLDWQVLDTFLARFNERDVIHV